MNRLVIGNALAGALLLGAAPGFARVQGASCDLNTENPAVNIGAQALIDASRATALGARDSLVNEAQSSLWGAIEADAAEDPAAWYWLGLSYGLAEDPIRADSMFDRTEELQPECTAETDPLRESLWAPIVNAGLDSLRQGTSEGAMLEFRRANVIYRGQNLALYYLGVAFANDGQNDSALYYFKHVAEMGEADSAGLRNYTRSLKHIANLHGTQGDWDSVTVWARRARERDANDGAMLILLTQVAEQAGNRGRLMMMYDSLIANAQIVTPDSLFTVGAKLFFSGDEDRAVRAFESGLEHNGYHRGALFNLASIYSGMAADRDRAEGDQDRAKERLIEVAQRLTDLDPANRESLGLLVTAYELQQMSDSASAVRQRSRQLSVEVRVGDVQGRQDGYAIAGTVTNLGSRQVQIPVITFEFLDAQGNVVTREAVPTGTLRGGGETNFNLDANGANIVAWRYAVSS